MTPDVFIFWFLSIVTVCSALMVVALPNPVYSALSLAMTMVGVAAIFVTLNSYFLAGVQIIVYAGAVTVLFVMVLMLFDLKNELYAFAKGKISGLVKLGTISLFTGIVVSAIIKSISEFSGDSPTQTAIVGDTTKEIGKLLFSKYIFSFEVLGVLLLIVAVGAVALSRSKGGTHVQR